METFKIKILPTRFGEKVRYEFWTLDQILEEINRDRSSKWTDYDESDWQEGWDEWIEGEFYSRH